MFIWRKISGFFQNIANLAAWFPIIWSDRDWDYCFLFDIMWFKLSRMAKYHRECGISINAVDIAVEIEACVAALHRLSDDNYAKELWDGIDRRWGEFRFEQDDNTGQISLCDRENVQTKEDEEAYRADVRKCIAMESEQIQDDLNIVFDTIKERVRGWWD